MNNPEYRDAYVNEKVSGVVLFTFMIIMCFKNINSLKKLRNYCSGCNSKAGECHELFSYLRPINTHIHKKLHESQYKNISKDTIQVGSTTSILGLCNFIYIEKVATL